MGSKNPTPGPAKLQDKEKPEKNSNKQLLLQAILAEYQAVNTRVFNQIARYEDATIKTLMLVGVLVTFYITQYKETDPYLVLVTNLICFVAFPIIVFGSLWLAFSDLIKVMILGDYLKIIENKVNNLLKDDHIEGKTSIYGFERNRVVDFEYWRIKHGYAKPGNSKYELSYSTIVVAITIIVCLFFSGARFHYILNNSIVDFYFWLWLFIGLSLVSLFITGLFLWKLNKRRKLTIGSVGNDALKYVVEEKKNRRRG